MSIAPLRKFGFIGILLLGLLMLGSLLALQLPVVQHQVVYHPAADWFYHRLNPDPMSYPTLRASLINNFPGFAYVYITDRLTRDLQDDQQIVLRLTEHVHENVFWPRSGYSTQDAAPIETLGRGIGVCDQQAHLLIELVDRRDIPAHLVFLKSPTSNAVPHSVSEVYINGKWRYADPLYMVSARDGNGELATRRQITSGEATFGPVVPEAIGLAGYRQLYSKAPKRFLKNSAAHPHFFEPVRRGEPLPPGSMGQSFKRLFALPEWIGTDLFINLYAHALHSLYPERDEWLYRVARTYHILLKYPQARRWYASLLGDYPDTRHREEALFFMGLAAYHEGKDPEALKALGALIQERPESAWSDYAHLYTGKIRLREGNSVEMRRVLNPLAGQSHGEPSRMAQRLLLLMANEKI